MAHDRKLGPKKDRTKREPITGPKVWVWSPFLAFLCGLEWEAPTLSIFQNAAKMSLSQIVDSDNPYAEFEKKDNDWVLIKTKSNPEALFTVVPSQTGSSTAVARSSTSRTTFLTCPPPKAVSSAVLDSPWASNEPLSGADLSKSVKDGKRKATEEVGDDRQGKRVEIGNGSQLERKLLEAQCKASLCREEEKRFREQAASPCSSLQLTTRGHHNLDLVSTALCDRDLNPTSITFCRNRMKPSARCTACCQNFELLYEI